KILDIKREYRWTSLKGMTPPKFISCVREYRANNKKQVMQLLDESHFESRFSRDPLLSKDKVAQLYHIWLENLLDSNENNRIALVIERNSQIQACGTVEKQDLSYAGIKFQLMSNGLYVSSS